MTNGASRFALAGALAIRRQSRTVSDPGKPERMQDTRAGKANEVSTEPYLTSLAKLFPAEALSALLLVLAIDETFDKLRTGMVVVIALACVLLRYVATRDPVTGKSDLLAVFVSLVSFLIYAAASLAFGVLFNTNEATTRIVATVAAILWMAILTEVVRKTPPKA